MIIEPIWRAPGSSQKPHIGSEESINDDKDDFREFVDTLQAALRQMEKAENPVSHIHPVIVREDGLAAVESEE